MDRVVYLNPRTCGIYKDGGTRFKTDPKTGLRTDEVDNELLDHVNMFLSGRMPEGSAQVSLANLTSKKVLVPTYYDRRHQIKIDKLLIAQDLEGITVVIT